MPAINTAPRYLVPREGITRVVAAKTIVARGAEFAGAPLGSWLLVVASAAAAFWVNAWLFAVSVVFLATTRMAIPKEASGDGFAPRRGNELEAAWGVGVGRLGGGDPADSELPHSDDAADRRFRRGAGVQRADDRRGAAAGQRGGLGRANRRLGSRGFGLGAAAAAGFLLWRKNVHRTGLAALSGLTAMGLSVVGLGFLPAFGLPVSAALVCAGLLGLCAGIGAGFYGTLVTSAVLKLAPTGQIGRVMSALSFASLGAVPITYALTGLVTDVSSAQVPFLIGGSLILVVAAVVFANPQLRHLSMNPTARATETANQNLRA